MRWGVLFIIVAILCLVTANSAAAGSLFDLTIPSDLGNQMAIGASDHSSDTLFDSANYDRKSTYAVFDYLSTRYSTVGPTNDNSYLAWIWSGTQEPRSSFDLIFSTFDLAGNMLVEIKLFNFANGPQIGYQILGANQQWAFGNLATNPVTISQWRTQGYKAEITLVPEPTCACVVILFITGIFGQIVRERQR